MTNHDATRPGTDNGESTAKRATVESVRRLNRKLDGLETELKRMYALLDEARQGGEVPTHIAQRVAALEVEAVAAITESRQLVAGIE